MAYTYPEEMPYVDRPLFELGLNLFEIRPNQHPFGEETRPTSMAVMRASTVFGVRHRLE
jgi:hypothetical protein